MTECEIDIGGAGFRAGNDIPLHRAWELSISGVVLRLERYGSHCQWNFIQLKKGERIVYEIKYTHKFSTGGDESIREEFFFGEFFRKYGGNQFSFIEYVVTIARQERLPEPEEYLRWGLEATIESQYRKYAQRILRE